MSLAAVFVCALAVGSLVHAERAGLRNLRWASKTLAAACFVLAAIGWGALDSEYGRVLLLGLVLCAAGDLLLLRSGTGPIFRAGVVSFGAGHLAYVLAFLGEPLHVPTALVAGLILSVLAGAALAGLAADLGSGLRALVCVYACLLVAMTALACAHWAVGGAWQAAFGALAFAASDVGVARARFRGGGDALSELASVAYFGAQLLLASSVSA
jgi:uncharacterized membrane protein YhhN